SDGIESQREVATEEFDLTVFNDHSWPANARRRPDAGASAGGEQAGNARGVASVALVPADAARLEQRIDDAVLMAQLVHNPPYSLPEPAEYPDVPLADPELSNAAGMSGAARGFAEELRGLVSGEHGVRLSAAELFLTHSEVELRTSRGV